jgi:hypothetical protein
MTMRRISRTFSPADTRTPIALALAGALLVAPALASAAPPQDPAPPPAAQPPGAAPQPAPGITPIPPAPAGLEGIPVVGQLFSTDVRPGEKPSLVKELPIATFVTAPVAGIGSGLVFKFVGGDAINDLKDPSKHLTPDQTHSLVVRARVGQAVSGVLFGITGLTTAWAAFGTVRTILKLQKFAKLPQVGVSAVPLPGGLAALAGGSF